MKKMILIIFVLLLQFVLCASADVGQDYDRAFELGYADIALKDIDKTKQISSSEYKQLLTDIITKTAPEQLAYFNRKVTDYETPLLRGEAVVMSWYAAVSLGVDNYNNSFDHERATGGDFWAVDNMHFPQLFPDCFSGDFPVKIDGNTWNDEQTAAYLWNVWHSSPVSGLQVIAFDNEAHSMRNRDPFTYGDAISAVTRLRDSIYRYADPEADESVFSGLSAGSSLMSISDLPRLTGFVLNDEPGSTSISAMPSQIDEIASWGFSSVRIMFSYEAFFNRDCSLVNIIAMEKLDSLVEAAINNGIHLNFLLQTLPGRTTLWDGITFETTGDFDLFLNPEKMEQAKTIWRIFAKRYKDVPGEFLSFTPFWSATNKNLSSGLDFQDYSARDVANALDILIGTIREEDPDRFIIYEVASNNTADEIIADDTYAYQLISDKYDNTRISMNFCEMPFVYAEMTATEGDNIDNQNHSMFKPDYPVVIYSAKRNLDGITIDGFLPQGTRIDIYLHKTYRTSLVISDEKGVIYSEQLDQRVYERSAPVSYYYPYSVTDKKISLTLTKDTEFLNFSGWTEWSGMDVFLPEEYAVERWYHYSAYDAFLDGRPGTYGFSKRPTSRVMIAPYDDYKGSHITIHDDVTYSSEVVFDQSTNETIRAWGEIIHGLVPDCLVRFENAFFCAGTTSASVLRYYDDMLTMFDDYNYDWYSSDYSLIVGRHGLEYHYFDANLIQYGDYPDFDIDLLNLLQSHTGDKRTP